MCRRWQWQESLIRDFLIDSEDAKKLLTLKNRYSAYIGIFHSPVYTFFKKTCIIGLNGDVQTGNLKFEIR